MTTALITGVRGQDGSYLAELLRARGQRVVGAVRDPTEPLDGIDLVAWDIADAASMAEVLRHVRPDHVYNLAARSSGAGMFDDAVAIGEVNGLAVTRLLEAIRTVDPAIRLVQASSSEMFGRPTTSPQNEATPFNPRSPYGVAKLYAHGLVGLYRERYGLFACSAILFNHESPRRRSEFVTRKITRAAARIHLGFASSLPLGDVSAQRDWGFAGDTVAALALMADASRAADYVIATGTLHSVADVCALAFDRVGRDWRDYVKYDAAALRPVEAVPLLGDARRAMRDLGWRPRTDLRTMIGAMVDADLVDARNERAA